SRPSGPTTGGTDSPSPVPRERVRTSYIAGARRSKHRTFDPWGCSDRKSRGPPATAWRGRTGYAPKAQRSGETAEPRPCHCVYDIIVRCWTCAGSVIHPTKRSGAPRRPPASSAGSEVPTRLSSRVRRYDGLQPEDSDGEGEQHEADARGGVP